MSTPAGLMLPTAKSYAPGAGNPRDSALVSQQQTNESQNNLNKTVGGKRKNRYRGGANDEVAVPQFQMQYTPQGGPGTNPNDQIADISSTSMQTTTWKANDNLATKMGGSKKKRRGGNSNWNWGCYSGGKKKRLSKKRKSKTKKRSKRRYH
jgi:hypothetical protein